VLTMQPTLNVLTLSTISRLALQNRVVRELRQLGCRVIGVAFDNDLTIQVSAESGQILRHCSSGILSRRHADIEAVSVRRNGCLVIWNEQASK